MPVRPDLPAVQSYLLDLGAGGGGMTAGRVVS